MTTTAAVRYMLVPAWDHLADDDTVVMVELEHRADDPYHVRLAVEGGAGVDVPLDVLTEGLTGHAHCAALSAFPLLDEECARWDVRVPGCEPVALRVSRPLLRWHLESLPDVGESYWDAFVRACVEAQS